MKNMHCFLIMKTGKVLQITLQVVSLKIKRRKEIGLLSTMKATAKYDKCVRFQDYVEEIYSKK